MARPFAYNPSLTPIEGTEQVGDVAIGVSAINYSLFATGVFWWMGPDETTGYVIAKPVPAGNQPFNPSIGATSAYIGFSRSEALTEASFVELANSIASGASSWGPTGGSSAKAWLNANGYWTSFAQGPTGPSTTNRILYWDIQQEISYNGSGNTITDIEGNANGTITGTISFTSGSPRYLTVEGGISEYIYTGNLNPHLSPVNTGTSQSTFLWIYPTSNGIIYSEQGTLTPDTSWFDAQIQRNSAGNFLFGIWPYSFNTPLVTSGLTYPLNNWYYVGWTYNGTTLRTFVNGTNVGSANVARQTPYNNGGNLPMYFNFGYPTSTDLGNTTSSTYRLGAVHVYNAGLTAGDVVQNYENTKTSYIPDIVTTDLTMRLDAANPSSYPSSGSTWFDLQGTQDNITLVGSPTYTNTAPAYFTFNGSSQYGTGTAPDLLSATSYTKSVWFYLNAIADNNIVSSGTGGHFMFFGAATSTMYCGHADWPSYTAFPSSTTFNINTWYCATLTFNTVDGMVLYINGTQNATYTANKNPRPGNGSTNIATYNGGNLLNGRISKVYTYSRSLTAAEVLQNYNADKSIFGL